MDAFIEFLQNFLVIIAGVMGVAFVLAMLLLAIVVRQVRHLDVPADADFSETLLLVPITVVLLIDMLDLALDFLAAPVAWIILDRLGLKALRGVSVMESLVPATQLIPTMTLCWLGVRLFPNTSIKQSSPANKRVTIDQK